MKVHEQVALAALVAIAAHGVFLLGDGWLRPGLSGIAVPFTLAYRPVFTGLGITGGYIAAVLGLGYYARRRLGARRWRQLHRFEAAVYVLAVVHALGSGTDGASVWFTVLVTATAVPIVMLAALRYRGRPCGERRSPVARRRPVRGGCSSAPRYSAARLAAQSRSASRSICSRRS